MGSVGGKAVKYYKDEKRLVHSFGRSFARAWNPIIYLELEHEQPKNKLHRGVIRYILIYL